MVVDPILITFTIVLIIVMFIGNLYFIAYYSHEADTFFGNSILTKVLLVSPIFSHSLTLGLRISAY